MDNLHDMCVVGLENDCLQDDLHKIGFRMIRAKFSCFELTFQGLSIEVLAKEGEQYVLPSFIIHQLIRKGSRRGGIKKWMISH